MSDQHPFHVDTDPDPGFKILANADPDPECGKFADPYPGLDFFLKISVFYVRKEKELWIRIKMQMRIQSFQKC